MGTLYPARVSYTHALVELYSIDAGSQQLLDEYHPSSMLEFFSSLALIQKVMNVEIISRLSKETWREPGNE